jgi:hypothetical protein
MLSRFTSPRMSRFLPALSFVLLLCPVVPCSAQHSPDEKQYGINPQIPLQVELLITLNASKLARGTPVLAKTRLDWQGPNCLLRTGALVSGHIVDFEPRSKQNKGSSLTILFDNAHCDGHLTPVGLTLVGLIVKPHVDEESPPLDSGFVTATAVQTGIPGSPNYSPQARLAFRNASSLGIGGYNANGPSHIAPGAVIGLSKVTLSVGTGPEGSSVLTAVKGNIFLQRETTQLVLMPSAAAVPGDALTATAKAEPLSMPPAPTSTGLPKLEPAPAVQPDETEICTALCSVVPSTIGHELSRASSTVSAGHFGYIPHNHREYQRFDYESTLIYLDSENLLFTFDPHTLRQRYFSGVHNETMRTVRAVLLDPRTLAVKRVREWQVQGEGQYIWRAGPGKILVHLGHQLRLLGPDLDVVHSVALSGRLGFVSVSPSGDRIAAGVLHERYAKEIHDLLVATVHLEPEEDVDIQLFDHDFNVLLTSRQSSTQPAPILSDDGEIRVTSAGNGRWRISEHLWNHTDRSVATTVSGCRPNVSTPLPKLLFLVGCSPTRAENWYRMLRLDGHPILQGHGSPQEIEQSSSSSTQDEFVVRVVHTGRPIYNNVDSFHKEDLIKQDFSVYHATDGRRLFLTTTPGVSLVEQSFALSPDGNQLAILSDATISFYPIGTSAESKSDRTNTSR